MTASRRDRFEAWLRTHLSFGRPVSMRRLLLGLVLITALPLLVLDLVLYQQLATAERGAVRERMMDSVHVLSALVDNEIDKHVAVAATLATSPALAAGELNAFALQAERAMTFLPGANLSLSDSTGHQILPSPAASGDAIPLLSQPEIVARAFASGKPQVSDVDKNANGQSTTAFVIFPVVNAEGPRYAILIALDLEQFGALILREFGRDEAVAVLDRRHNPVALRANGGQGPLVAHWQAQIPGAPEGIADSKGSRGERFVTAYAPTRDGWTVGISIPASEVEAPVRRILWVTSISAVALALLSLGVGRWIAARLSRSMAQLVVQARSVGRGRRIPARSFITQEASAISEAMAAASRELARRQAALRDSESRFRGTFENAAVGVAHVGLDGTWLEINQRFCDIVGYSHDELRARTFQDITHPDDLATDLEGVRSLLEGRAESYSLEKRYLRKDGSIVWVGLTVALQRDAAGAPKYFISIIRDISRRREAEDHQQFLLHELAHRSKNQLAIILAMARITSRDASSLEVFRDQFGKRIQGLVISTELLVAQQGAGAVLADLVRRQLQAFVPAPLRLRSGGPDVILATDAAEAIGLSLHELATNSLKYGAWSSPSGVVTVNWDVESDDGAELRLSWVESGGPEVRPPSRRGFGHEVVERMVAQKLDGKVELKFDPEGLSWTLTVPAKYFRQA